jgi:hypothetical protein
MAANACSNGLQQWPAAWYSGIWKLPIMSTEAFWSHKEILDSQSVCKHLPDSTKSHVPAYIL